MSVEKVSLSSLRFLLFFIFAAAGCLLPFLSLHTRATGLTLEEARLISIIAPLVAVCGPAIAGPLVDFLSSRKRNQKSETGNDNNACVRTVLSASVLLSAIFYSLLLSVPTVERLPPRQPRVSFVCNEFGASLVQEKCNELGCYHFPNQKTGSVVLRNCKFNCTYPAHYGYIEHPSENLENEIKTTTGSTTGSTGKTSTSTSSPTSTTSSTTTTVRSMRPEVDLSNMDSFFGPEPSDDDDGADAELGSGEELDFDWNPKTRRTRDVKDDFSWEGEPPHICYNNLSPTHKKDDKNPWMCYVYTHKAASLSVNVSLRPVHEDDQYCSYLLGGNFSCKIPHELEKPNESCKLFCDLENPYASDSLLLQSQCEDVNGDPSFTFWLYLIYRSLGDLFTSITISLLLGATLVAVRHDIGKEFIIPSVAYGICAILVGYFHSHTFSPLNMEKMPNFFFGVVGFGLLSMFALCLLIFATNIPIGPPEWWWTNRNVQVRHKGEFCAVLFVLVLMGALWGPFYSHVPWHIADPKGLELYVGCSVAMGALLSVCVVWKADIIIDYCGYSNIFICAFTIYILRYTGLFFAQSPWVLLITGGMEVFTMCLMIFSSILYIRHLVPKHLTFTSQSWGVAAHFCLGNSLGCFVTTILSESVEEIEAALRNSTELKAKIKGGSEEVGDEVKFELYHKIYCVGAISAAAIALIYFFAYHCCLKKRCLAPPYRKEPTNVSLVEGPAGNGMYTPLTVYHNGREPTRAEVTS